MSATSRWLAVVVAVLMALVGTGQVASASVRATPSTTTMALSSGESAYGQTVTATASVATVPGPAQGDVVFSVDGLAVKANLGASGTATVVLPDAMVGEHAVQATFVPQVPTDQQGSRSPIEPWVVEKARTRLQVRVIGKGARIPTKVQVKAAGDHDSRPTGRVRIEVRHTGARRVTRAVVRMDAAVALFRLGRLAKGRHRLVVTYVGDSQHRRERQVERFHVRRR